MLARTLAQRSFALATRGTSRTLSTAPPKTYPTSEKTLHKYSNQRRKTLIVLGVCVVGWPLEIWLTN